VKTMRVGMVARGFAVVGILDVAVQCLNRSYVIENYIFEEG
jgi:hypothetical protein